MNANTTPVDGVAVERLDPADDEDLDGDKRRQELDTGEVGRVEVHGRHVGLRGSPR